LRDSQDPWEIFLASLSRHYGSPNCATFFSSQSFPPAFFFPHSAPQAAQLYISVRCILSFPDTRTMFSWVTIPPPHSAKKLPTFTQALTSLGSLLHQPPSLPSVTKLTFLLYPSLLFERDPFTSLPFCVLPFVFHEGSRFL